MLTCARAAFAEYRESMQEDRRVLIDHYELRILRSRWSVWAASAPFVASCYSWRATRILFLQVKEVRRSVLEAYAGKSIYPNHGQRVVNGYRLMQSASDIFLGWTRVSWAGISTSAS